MSRGFKKPTRTIKKPQKKADKKRSITILPRAGIIGRAPEKTKAENPYTQIRAAAEIRAKAKRPEAIMIKPVPARVESGEWEPQKR
jgi:hypothetical protein